MEKFIKPEIEVITFEEEDVIVTSPPCGDATVIVPDVGSGDADGCGFGPCGPNDVTFD